jgi:dipeptidyl aminopeptidase/acylaminoacyl peptidase
MRKPARDPGRGAPRTPAPLLTAALLFLAVATAGPAPSAGAEPIPVREPNRELAARWTPDRIHQLLYSVRVQPRWLPDGDRFWYSYETREGRRYWLVDPERRRREPLFDHERLAAALNRLRPDTLDADALDLEDLSPGEDLRTIDFALGEARYRYDGATGGVVLVDSVRAGPEEEEWANVSPDGALCLYRRGHDLYLCRAEDPGGSEVRLSRDGAPGLCWGENASLGDEEDADAGARRPVPATWAPDSRRFCILRADERAVGDMWFVDHLARPRPRLRTYKLELPGEADVTRWELWVYDPDRERLLRIDTDRFPDQDLQDLFHETQWWSPDSQTLYFTRRSRDYRSVDLCAADPRTGASRTLIEERLDGMVYIRPPVQLPRTGELVWWSMRDGWGHLYHYGADGEPRRQITRGAWYVERIAAVDTAARALYVVGMGREPGRDPYYEHLYRVDLDGGEPLLLTPEDADHSVDMSPGRRWFVDNHGRVDRPTVSVLRDARGERLLELETTDVSRLVAAGWQPPTSFVAMSADGVTEQWGVMYRPFDFDPGRRYPLVTRVYPGRQGEFVPKAFWPVTAEATLAQYGCIVVQFGNRGGTPRRGLAYREHGRDDFRGYGLADKRAVLEQLAARHEWIDAERIGIYGGSSGGFMTVSALLEHPDFFKVGVAMTAPNDPAVYYRHWAERYGILREARDGDGGRRWEYVAEGNLELADRLEGDLLLIYGEQDANVNLAHLFRMADAFMKAGERFDMFVIPGADHRLGGWRYLYGLVWDYFAENLIAR